MDSTSIITQVNKEDETVEVNHFSQEKRKFSWDFNLLFNYFSPRVMERTYFRLSHIALQMYFNFG